MRVAVIGDGIVAAFAVRAAFENVDVEQIDVFSRRGGPTFPPSGAFYLHDLPRTLRAIYPSARHLELVIGDSPKTYTERLWGAYYPSSIDDLYNEVVTKNKPRELRVWRPTPSLIQDLFTGATWHKQEVDRDRVDELAEEYDLVALCAPIQLGDAQPPAVQRLPVIRLSEDTSALTGSEVANTALRVLRMDDLVNYMSKARDKYLCTGMTVYNAVGDGAWLRATIVEEHVDVELLPLVVTEAFWSDVVGHTNALAGSKLQPSEIVEALQSACSMVTKIHPASSVRNLPPRPNIFPCGRWASWRRGELSHETYGRIRGAMADIGPVSQL